MNWNNSLLRCQSVLNLKDTRVVNQQLYKRVHRCHVENKHLTMESANTLSQRPHKLRNLLIIVILEPQRLCPTCDFWMNIQMMKSVKVFLSLIKLIPYCFMLSGHDIFQSSGEGRVNMDLAGMSSEEVAAHRLGCFNMLVYVPLACALLQLATWSRFSLRGRRLIWIKSVRAGSQYSTVWPLLLVCATC